MAAGDLADLQARVRVRGSFNPSDTGLTADVLKGFINAALKQIGQEHDWPWLKATVPLTTVNGLGVYPMPADWQRTRWLVVPSTGGGLSERPIEDLDDIAEPLTGGAGQPYLWAVDGDQLVLKPVPNAAYELRHRYITTEALLSAPTDLPKIPTSLDEGVVEWATMLAFRFTRQYDKAEAAGAAYNAWLNATTDIVRRGRRQLRIRVRPGAAF